MGGSPENETIKYNNLRIGVDECVSLTVTGLSEEALNCYFASSDSEHVSVNNNEKTITGISKGEATITLNYPSSGSTSVTPFAIIKVYVSETDTFISPRFDFANKLFIEPDNEINKNKIIAMISNDICSLEDILINWNDKIIRKDAAQTIGISVYEADLYFRLAALWQIPKMTKEFAYLAALTGIRNAYDLSRVSAQNLQEAFQLLEYNVCISHNGFKIPGYEEINDIINCAKSLNKDFFDYYDINGDLPSMPSSLLSNESFFKTDSEIINEGLMFLENLTPALPLPKVISGKVEINDDTKYGDLIPFSAGGLLVSIYGISEPSKNRTEDEKEYFSYTDPTGSFSIVLPDKYNMQETVTISVTKKNDMRYAIAGQVSTNKVEFVKRASEILQNEYITLSVEKDGKRENERKYASEILASINTLRQKNSEAMEIEKVLRRKAYNIYAKKYKYMEAEAAKNVLEECRTDIKKEVRYHIKNFYEQIKKLFASFDYKTQDNSNDHGIVYDIPCNSIAWQIDTVKAKPGETVSLNVYVRDPHNIGLVISDMDMCVFSQSSIQLISYDIGNAYNYEGFGYYGVQSFSFKNPEGTEKSAKDGSVLSVVELSVPEDCPPGNYPIYFMHAAAHSPGEVDVTDRIIILTGAVIVEKADTSLPHPNQGNDSVPPSSGGGQLIEYDIPCNSIGWQIDTVKAKPGETVSLNVYVRDPYNTGLALAAIKFAINAADKITLNDIKDGHAYSSDKSTAAFNKKDRIVAIMDSMGREKTGADNAIVAILEYTVPDDCPAGKYQIGFSHKELEACTENSELVNDRIMLIDGAVIVEGTNTSLPYYIQGNDFVLPASGGVQLHVIPDTKLISSEVKETIKVKESHKPKKGNQFIDNSRPSKVTKSRNKYQWYKDDDPISGATSVSYTADSEGRYYCEIKNTKSANGKSSSQTYKTNIVVVRSEANSVSADNQYDISEEKENILRAAFYEGLNAKLDDIRNRLEEFADNWDYIHENEDNIYIYKMMKSEHCGNGYAKGADPYVTINSDLCVYLEGIINELYDDQNSLRTYFYNNDFFFDLITTNKITLIESNGGGHIYIPDCHYLSDKINEYITAKNEYAEAKEVYDFVCKDIEYSNKSSESDEWFERYIYPENYTDDDDEIIVEAKTVNYIDDFDLEFDYEDKSKQSISDFETIYKYSYKDPAQISNTAADKVLVDKYRQLIQDCVKELNPLLNLVNTVEYDNKKYSNKKASNQIVELDERSATSKLIERCILNFLTTPMNSEFPGGSFKINKSDFEENPLHPRALPSVKLMGDGKNEIYLPTDTAPSRVFNYTMINRLVEPKIKKNGKNIKRSKLSGALDIQGFRDNLREDHAKIVIADSLGIGYSLNMHQEWIPDGFALGNLLYSLILAPGEEQRLIVREHNEAYTVSDDANAYDYLRDSYRSSQLDNETAAFMYGADRSSRAHSNSGYTSTATSSGKTKVSLDFNGVSSSTSSTSTNTGSSYANSSQLDSYDEASRTAQNFQTDIKTESERIANETRTSIRIATSDEKEAVSSRIIANHNHSHVMTVQYWEITRRYRLETCIDSVDLLLFVPLELIDFMPKKQKKTETVWSYGLAGASSTTNSTDNEEYIKKILTNSFYDYYLNIDTKTLDTFERYGKELFKLRYDKILKHYDVINNYIPGKYRSGLNLMKKFADLPYWNVEQINTTNSKYTLTISGNFCEFDNLSATIFFNNGSHPVRGVLTKFAPSELILSKKEYRSSKDSGSFFSDLLSKVVSKRPHTRAEVKRSILNIRSEDEFKSEAVFSFTLPYGCIEDDISQIVIENKINSWNYTLSQNKSDMTDSEEAAIKKYESLYDSYNKAKEIASDYDVGLFKGLAISVVEEKLKALKKAEESLPECYKHPVVSFTASELYSIGELDIEVYSGASIKDSISSIKQQLKTVPGSDPDYKKIKQASPLIATGILGSVPLYVNVDNYYPKLRVSDLQKIEETFHHIVSDTMYYSQAIWESLSDDERIILLEPYTIEFSELSKIASPESTALNSNKDKRISLLNCVNAKNVVGFYGNCMMLPFTFPPELVELLGKTSGDMQNELYRYHARNFRVPSTIISVPTDGMVGEAVLGSTNVSEKIDITRFWNWKDSDIDHINIDQSSLNGKSLLENATTKDAYAPTVGVTPTEHINGNNLAAALIARQQPTFADVYKNTDMRDVMQTADRNASAGREQVIEKTAELTKAAFEAAVKAGTAAATGGASEAVGGATGSGGISNLLGALGDAGLGNSDLGKLMKKGLGENGSLNGVAKGIAGMIGSGESDELKEGLSAISGDDLKQFLTRFASNSASEEYKKLEDNFTNSISGLVENPETIKTADIINMAKQFCVDNNIELSDVTRFLGDQLGII